MQASLQRNIDASISSTINLPESATEKDVYDIYMYAWKAGLKGVTIFRQDCARDAILKVEEKGKKEEKKKDIISYNSITPVSRKQIGVTHGSTFCKKCACGTLYITVNKDKEGNIVEVFTHTSKGGICQANLNAETRMASLALRSGVKVSEVTDQLKGISCPACTATKAKGKKIDGISCADIIAKTIEEFQLNNIKWKSEYPATEEEAKHYSIKYDKCPGCGEYTLIHEAGCVLCGNCGYSKCE
jgi:ribonucleoside-diphosphate reductase alpha chain